MAVILRWRQTFFIGNNTESWICQQDSHENFTYFELLINVLNTDLYKHSHNPMIPMYRKFNDDASVRFGYHEKCSYFIYKGVYRADLEASLWRHRWRYPHEKYFLYTLGRSFHIWGQIEAVFDISKFSKWPPFWGRDKLFTGSNTGSWIYQQDRHERFRYFLAFGRRSSWNIDGDIAISNFDLLCDLVTSSMTSWIPYLCTRSLMIFCSF